MTGVETEIGTMPRPEELRLDGLALSDGDRGDLFAIDTDAWRREIAARRDLLAGFTGVPSAIGEAHARLERGFAS